MYGTATVGICTVGFTGIETKNNQKMAKKRKKTNQTANLQESEDPKFTENPVEDTENPVSETTERTENLEDESETTMAMVYCKNCKEDVDPYSTEKGWKCPGCNKFVQSPDIKKGGETIREVKSSKDRPYEIASSRNIKFSGNELAQAEMLIQSGVASNFNDLAKKAFNILFLKEKVNKAFGMDINKMEREEPNPERTMKEIQQQEMMKAYIEGMRKGNQTDPLSMMMLMRMMDNKEQGKSSNNVMDKMLEIQMMKSVMGGQNSETSGLQKEIAELKHQMSTQQMLNQNQQMQQTGQSSQQFMQEMEKIRSERDKSIKQAEVDAQKERDKNLQLAFENRRIELEGRLQAIEKEKKQGSGNLASNRIKEMKEEIAAIKELSAMIGDREKGAGEMIVEGLGNVVDKVGPAFTELLKQKRQQTPYPPAQENLPPQPSQVPQEVPPQAFETPNPNLDEPLPPSDMTPTEKEMSDQMSDMYIKKKDA